MSDPYLWRDAFVLYFVILPTLVVLFLVTDFILEWRARRKR